MNREEEYQSLPKPKGRNCRAATDGYLFVRDWYGDKEYGKLVELIHNSIKYYQENCSNFSDKWVRRELSETIADQIFKKKK